MAATSAQNRIVFRVDHFPCPSLWDVGLSDCDRRRRWQVVVTHTIHTHTHPNHMICRANGCLCLAVCVRACTTQSFNEFSHTVTEFTLFIHRSLELENRYICTHTRARAHTPTRLNANNGWRRHREREWRYTTPHMCVHIV